MANTKLDELVEYPVKALNEIGTDETVLKLLTNNPDIKIDSEEADEAVDKYLFDYGYVDNTTEEAAAYICCEAEIVNSPTPTIQNMEIYITVICHKQYMKLDASKFKGFIGNRRENLTRFIDSRLNGSEIFGIGKLKFKSARVVPAPTGFAARELTYVIPDFYSKT